MNVICTVFVLRSFVFEIGKIGVKIQMNFGSNEKK